MIGKIKISVTPPVVLVFDGEVLECFFEDGSRRVHVIHITGIELADDKDKHLLTIHLMAHKDIFIWVDEPSLAKVKGLMDEIKQAMASSHAG